MVVLLQDTAGPLKGVIIAVCKKLSKNQSEYNNIAVSLGADYRWMYDSSCTHFIFQVHFVVNVEVTDMIFLCAETFVLQ